MLRPPSTVTRDNAKHMSAVISAGPNANAACATGTESSARRTMPITPPMNDVHAHPECAACLSSLCKRVSIDDGHH